MSEPNKPEQSQPLQVVSTPPEVAAIAAIVQPLVEAFNKNAEVQAKAESDRNATERLKIVSTNRTVAGVFVVAMTLLALAGIALFQNKDALVQALASAVVGMLAGFGIGHATKPK